MTTESHTDAPPRPLTEAQADYARTYQAARKARNAQYEGIFLPMEYLVRRHTGESFLSVSLSASGAQPLYVTRRAQLYRIVRLTTRWLIVPSTISRVFTHGEFEAAFSEMLSPVTVDSEHFWRIGSESFPAMQTTIAAYKLDNSFRDAYHHGYVSE